MSIFSGFSINADDPFHRKKKSTDDKQESDSTSSVVATVNPFLKTNIDKDDYRPRRRVAGGILEDSEEPVAEDEGWMPVFRPRRGKT
jgi:hypothetical protein